MSYRKIIHIDMDCFFAAVEIRDNPSLMGKPVAVGGSSVKRGVLCTCNYEARKYGIHSAMSTEEALRICPDLIVLPVNSAKYRLASSQVFDIFKKYTEIIEPLSLDEAFLDVTDSMLFNNSATLIAEDIKASIYNACKLTASAGVSVNKFLAKIASDWKKPNGLYVITPDKIKDFILKLPVKKIYGVGKVTYEKLYNMGIITCADLQKISLDILIEKFGSFGERLYELARGIDNREVCVERERKSLSIETTFNYDISDLNNIYQDLDNLILQLHDRLVKKYSENFIIKKQFLKLKFYDFTQTTVECLSNGVESVKFYDLLTEGYKRYKKPVRLLGIGVRFIEKDAKEQNLVKNHEINFE